MKHKQFLLIFLMLLSLFAKGQVRIEIVKYPPLLVPENPIYLATDFNNWNSGDVNYTFKKDPSGIYYIELENPPKVFEYKFTQGNWTMVEGDSTGKTINNRVYNFNQEENKQIIRTSIAGWEKRAMYSLFVTNIPKGTPKDAKMYLMGNFNNWEAEDPNYELKRNIDGAYHTIVYSDLPRLEYKINRGSLESIESRDDGKARPNRVILRNSSINHKSISIEVEGWEDQHGVLNFFSMLDLLLIFSIFQGILLVIAIPTIHNYNKEANRWLVISIIFTSISLFFHIISSYQAVNLHYPKLVLIEDFAYFIYAPLFYFYLQKILFETKALSSRAYFHFIPVAIQFFVYLPYLLMDGNEFRLKYLNESIDIQWIFAIMGMLGFIWNLYYWLLFRKAINFYKEAYQTHYSYEQNLPYLSTVLIIQAICLSLWAFMFLMYGAGYFFKFDNQILIERSIEAIWLIFSVITYFVGYFAIHQPETFKVNPTSFSIFDDVLEHRVVETIGHKNKAEIEEQPNENMQVLKDKIDKYIQKHRPYTNPKLTLNELSSKLKMPPHLVSKVINDGFDKNFFDFVNTYRIEEFKRLVKDTAYQHLTLLSVAYEVGFNSKTAFNRSFKKITDQTPKEYFDSVKE